MLSVIFVDIPTRKPNRLKDFDYSQNGAYFVTICTKDKHKLLCNIVGDGVLDVPSVRLTSFGKIADNQIQTMNSIYSHINVDKYIIMPNHIHMLLSIQCGNDYYKGTSRTPSPTNNIVSQFVSTFKRFCNKQYGQNIWHRSYHDHIIRNDHDYLDRWNYIENNPLKWNSDRFYTEN